MSHTDYAGLIDQLLERGQPAAFAVEDTLAEGPGTWENYWVFVDGPQLQPSGDGWLTECGAHANNGDGFGSGFSNGGRTDGDGRSTLYEYGNEAYGMGHSLVGGNGYSPDAEQGLEVDPCFYSTG